MTFLESLNQSLAAGEISEKVYTVFKQLYDSYAFSMLESGFQRKDFDHLFEDFLFLVKKHLVEPFHFEPYHQKILQPHDYFRFGIEFVRPLIDQKKTRIFGENILKKIEFELEAKENAILFANHQTEVDPQIMSLILEKSHRKLGEEVIFVAGDRVLTDPLAVPFSMGRNLLCIYSKRHIDQPPEKKEEKLQHNQRTMMRMKELLSEGGKFIYVAPSGGRDRPDEKGEVVVAPFDPQSIEMFRLMAKQAHKPTHFYPLSLVTFDILPPPPSVETELGEMRKAKREGALFAFGDELDMEHCPGSELTDRHAKRSARAEFIWNIVNKNYHALKRGVNP
jgi:glycerol-3-phosphate O-acyltransferase